MPDYLYLLVYDCMTHDCDYSTVLPQIMPPKKKGKKEEAEGKKRGEEGEEGAGLVKGVGEEGGGLEEVIRAEREAKKRFQELLRKLLNTRTHLLN